MKIIQPIRKAKIYIRLTIAYVFTVEPRYNPLWNGFIAKRLKRYKQLRNEDLKNSKFYELEKFLRYFLIIVNN